MLMAVSSAWGYYEKASWDSESRGEPRRRNLMGNSPGAGTQGSKDVSGALLPPGELDTSAVSLGLQPGLLPSLTSRLRVGEAAASGLASVPQPPFPGCRKRQVCAPRTNPGEPPRPALAPGCRCLTLLNKS